MLAQNIADLSPSSGSKGFEAPRGDIGIAAASGHSDRRSDDAKADKDLYNLASEAYIQAAGVAALALAGGLAKS